MDCHDLSHEFSILSIVQSIKKTNIFQEIVIIKTFDICCLSAWPSKFNTSKEEQAIHVDSLPLLLHRSLE